MTDPLVLVSGTLAAALTAVLGYIGTARGQRAQNSVEFSVQVREWATQLQASEEKCRLELEVVRAELNELRRKLERLERRAVEEDQ